LTESIMRINVIESLAIRYVLNFKPTNIGKIFEFQINQT